MKTTTFTQAIGDERIVVTIPQHRVVTVIDRIDRYIEKGQLKKAMAALEPFTGPAAEAREETARPTKTTKTSEAVALIEELRSKGRRACITALQEKLGLAKGTAYSLTRKYNV